MYHITITDDQKPEFFYENDAHYYLLCSMNADSLTGSQCFGDINQKFLLNAMTNKDQDQLNSILKIIVAKPGFLLSTIAFIFRCSAQLKMTDTLIMGLDRLNEQLLEESGICISISKVQPTTDAIN